MDALKSELQLHLEQALGTLRAGDWSAAFTSWESSLAVWLKLARQMRDSGHIEQAEQILALFSDGLLNDYETTFDYALIAYRQKNWLEAIRRFEILRSRYPNDVTSYRYIADLLFRQERYEEADAVYRDGMVRLPNEVSLVVAYAWAAHLRADKQGNWGHASDRWRHLASAFPNNPLGPTMLGFVLTRYLGQLDEADALLRQAIQRFPDDIDVAVQYARVPDHRQDWDEAMRRWDAAAARWPTAQAVLEGRGETVSRRQLHEIECEECVTPEYQQEAGQADAASVLMQFETLGENCEFGFAQRHFGAEPLGLFRWMGGTNAEHVCSALETRLATFDHVGNFEVRLNGTEYMLFETNHKMFMHTFILQSEFHGSPDQLRDQLFRRTQFLKRKLLTDLSSAEKIFVWQSGMGSFLSDETEMRLYRAVRSFGNNTLLIIRRHNNPAEPPVVVPKLPGLLIGSMHQVDAVRLSDGSERVVSPFRAWLDICQFALRFHRTISP